MARCDRRHTFWNFFLVVRTLKPLGTVIVALQPELLLPAQISFKLLCAETTSPSSIKGIKASENFILSVFV